MEESKQSGVPYTQERLWSFLRQTYGLIGKKEDLRWWQELVALSEAVNHAAAAWELESGSRNGMRPPASLKMLSSAKSLVSRPVKVGVDSRRPYCGIDRSSLDRVAPINHQGLEAAWSWLGKDGWWPSPESLNQFHS